jgi:hypothetical protein
MTPCFSPLTQFVKERDAHCSEAIGLFDQRAVAGVLYLFDSHSSVEPP